MPSWGSKMSKRQETEKSVVRVWNGKKAGLAKWGRNCGVQVDVGTYYGSQF